MQLDGEKFQKLVKLCSKGAMRTADQYWRDTYGFDIIEDMETKWRTWVVSEW